MPHRVPSHVAPPWASAGHGSHEIPQVAGASLRVQAPEHRCHPVGHPVIAQAAPLQEEVAPAGAAGQGAHAPLHRSDPALHDRPHVPDRHVAEPRGSPGQGSQRAPQVSGEASLAHESEHSCSPLPHPASTHAAPSQPKTPPATAGHCVHAPPHSRYPPSHERPQAPCVHVAAPCASPGQGSHRAPHVEGESSRTHASPHRWRPVVHPASTQRAASQAKTPSATAGHAAHVPAHRRLPRLQESPHRAPSQVAAPFGSVGHGSHRSAQVAVSVLRTHAPPHRCHPPGHAERTHAPAAQANEAPCGAAGQGAHAPAQSLNPSSQSMVHAPAAHAGTPCGSAGQRAHEGPHACGSASAAHASPHMWKPAWQAVATHALSRHVTCAAPGEGHTAHAPPHARNPGEHCTPQAVPSQLAVPFGSTGQASQRLPQFCGDRLDTQAPAQKCCSAGHWHTCDAGSQPAGAGQSEAAAQPSRHVPLVVSHRVPAGQGAVRQSSGGVRHAPAAQTSPRTHTRSHRPQCCRSVVGSTHPSAHASPPAGQPPSGPDPPSRSCGPSPVGARAGVHEASTAVHRIGPARRRDADFRTVMELLAGGG